MRYRLHADVVLTAGSGAKPIILVSRSSGRRVDLTEEQAAIAVLLTGGASWEQLVDEARRCGLDWQGQKLHDYISLLMVQDLLTVTQDAATQDIAAAAEPADEDVGYEEDQDTVVSDLLVADDEDEAGEADEEEDEQTVVEGFDILEAHAAFAPAAEHAPATDEVPQQLPHAPPGQPSPAAFAPPPAVAFTPPPPPPPPAAPRPPAGGPPPEASVEQLAEQRLLARALLLVRDGDYEAAEMALQALQQSEESPSLQTVMVLQLLRTAQLAARGGQAQPSKPRGRLLLWIVLVFLVLLLGGGAALFLIKVEARRVVVCRVDRKPVAPIKAPIGGRVARVHVKKQQVLGAGKAALVIATRDKRAEARLRAIIASDKELLRIMRTGGKDADVRKQKRIKRDVEARIAKLGDCKDAACREKKTDLQRELEAAKTKLHFCEWQAYKREADAKAKELAAKEQRLSKQLAAQNRTVIASKGGIVTKHIAAGTTVEKGQTLVEMDDAKNASAVLLIARDPPKSGQLVVVTLAGQGWTKRIKAKTSSEAGRVSVALELDVSKITASTRCRADVPAPPIPLAVSLWRDLR